MDFRRKKRTTQKKRLPKISQKTVQNMLGSWQLLLLLAILTCGMVFGAALLKHSQGAAAEKILELLEQYRLLRETQSLLETFCNAMLLTLLLTGLAYMGGLCAVGLPVLVCLPFLKGLATGVISGYFYSTFALKGLGYSLLLICPGAFLSSLGLLLCCNESMKQTKAMYHLVSDTSELQREGGLRLYNLRFAVLLLLGIAAAALDAVLNRSFVQFFDFGV